MFPYNHFITIIAITGVKCADYSWRLRHLILIWGNRLVQKYIQKIFGATVKGASGGHSILFSTLCQTIQLWIHVKSGEVAPTQLTQIGQKLTALWPLWGVWARPIHWSWTVFADRESSFPNNSNGDIFASSPFNPRKETPSKRLYGAH